MLGEPITHPNILLLFLVWAIAATMGAGYGIVLHTAMHRWPAMEAIKEVLYWFLFITAGVYGSYAKYPWYVAAICMVSTDGRTA